MWKRYFNLLDLLKKKSLLLLGPRQTGKSTLVRQVQNSVYINLADSIEFRTFSTNPELIRQKLLDNTKVLVIDEAQKVPELFDEVQILLDRDKSLRVVLTGNSARKLRRNNINLLPGRIWRQFFYPLVYPELPGALLEERAKAGSLPGILLNANYKEELRSYVSLYLEEEIRQEALTRNIGNFSRFLEVAALTNAEQLNYQNVANDTGIHENTVRSFYEVLQDTLIGHVLPTFRKTKTRKAVATPKFYFFDWGMVNGLLNRFDVSDKSDTFGKALEHIIFQEIQAFLGYKRLDIPLTYWRTHSKHEVDFVIGDEVAIEVKSKNRVSESDSKSLCLLAEEIPVKKIIVCRESSARRMPNGTLVLPVEGFLKDLWDGKIIQSK